MAKACADQEKSKEAGFTLIETVIAVALFGLLVLFAQRALYLNEIQRGMKEADHELIMAKADFLTQVDCNETVFKGGSGGEVVAACNFSPPTCPKANYMSVFSKRRESNNTRKVLIRPWTPNPNDSNTVAAYGDRIEFRATCGCCPSCVGGKGIFVEYQKRINKHKYEFRPLFSGIPLKCVVP